MTASDRLKSLRKHLQLNQKDFSDKIGIQQGNLSYYESGKRELGKRLQEQVIRTFDVNPTWWETGKGQVAANSKKISIHRWSDLEGPVLGYCDFPLFADADKICEYTGKDFDDIKKGGTIALRSTKIPKVAEGDLIVVTTAEGSFIGYMVSYEPKSITLKNDFEKEFLCDLVFSTQIYRVVGVANRFI